MVIFRCYFSGEHIAVAVLEFCMHVNICDDIKCIIYIIMIMIIIIMSKATVFERQLNDADQLAHMIHFGCRP